MNADGISYLDMADAYLWRDWPNAISTVWSPLYAWLLAAGRLVLGAGPASEFPTVQAVNFVIFLVSVAAFGFLMRSLLRYRRTVPSAAPVSASVSDRALLAAGYAVFVWSALDLIGVNLVTPHLTVAALISLAVGLLLRIAMGRAGIGVHLGLGVVLGLAYLARTPMAALALVMLGLATAAGWRHAAGWRRLSDPAAALAAFVVVAGIYAVPLYFMKGQMPLGDFPRINYAFWVNGYPRQHWQGDPPGSGTPRHPTRKLWTKPAVYEFGEPVGGTYPPWYDPSYWYAGIQPRFDPVGHVRVLQRSVQIESLRDAIDHWVPSVIFAVVAGLYAGARGWLTWRGLVAHRYLLIPAVIGFGLFAPVQLIPRYVGGFVPLLWLGVMAALNPSSSRWARRTVQGLAVAVLVFHAGLAAPGIAKRGLAVAVEAVWGTPASTDVHWQVASALHEMGIGPGARVAVLGSGFNAYWARLLRAKIIAEIPVDAAADYWAASGQTRARIARLLADAGAEVLVASSRVLPSSVGPGELAAMGWRRVGETDFHALFLPR